MSDDALQSYSDNFHDEIATDAHSMEMFREEAFVEKTGEILAEYGEVNGCEPSPWKDKGYKVDAYEFDDDYENLTLIVSHWIDKKDLYQAKVNNSMIDRLFRQGTKFLMDSLKGRLGARIEVSNPAHDLTTLIHECREDMISAKIVIITDGVVGERPGETEEVEDLDVSKVVWDIQRIQRFVRTGEREHITIDFANRYGGAIPCIEQVSPNNQYTTYLAFIPGEVLADLYGDWKIRLLERNVRVFLSQRVKVNREIRDTIRDEPGMFCAYNNGITVYAQSVELASLNSSQQGIASVKDFQIVNGGQTTASLFHTRASFNSDLKDITVQMKLMVINDEMSSDDLPENQRLSDILVPKIGKWSNTQNRIQMADLLANDPPHPELYAISRNHMAPDPTGGSLQTFWFYEKSRGSYDETRRLEARTKAQQRKFDQKYVKKQRFDKSKFGKAWNSYLRLPHTVCLGAMKNFALFNTWLQNLKDEDWTVFFEKTVALILLWNETERIVRRQKFGGYNHAIVTYSLAWLHHLAKSRIELSKIWMQQKIDENILDALELICIIVNDHIRQTNLNPSEWCKDEKCWNKLMETHSPDLPGLKSHVISKKNNKSVTNGENDAIAFCKEKGSNAWRELSKFLKDTDFMSAKARSQCNNMGRILKEKREPSPRLSKPCYEIWHEAEKDFDWEPGLKE